MTMAIDYDNGDYIDIDNCEIIVDDAQVPDNDNGKYIDLDNVDYIDIDKRHSNAAAALNLHRDSRDDYVENLHTVNEGI